MGLSAPFSFLPTATARAGRPSLPFRSIRMILSIARFIVWRYQSPLFMEPIALDSRYEWHSLGDTRPSGDSTMEQLSVFISHSSHDASLAGEVALLVQHALALTNAEIRCTSAAGFRLQAGVDIDDIIRGEVAAAKTLVALLTPESLDSRYVLFELAARWGARLSVIPLLAHGVSEVDLPLPLRRLNAIRATDSSDLHQLVHDLGVRLNRELQAANFYQQYLAKVQASARQPHSEMARLRAAVVGMLAAARYVHCSVKADGAGRVKLFNIWHAYNDHELLRSFGQWLSASLPTDASCIVAVERSGIPPAVLAAVDRHLPMFCVPKDPTCPSCGKAAESLADSPSTAKLLAEASEFDLTNTVLFDDSIHSGSTLQWARDQVIHAGGMIRAMFALIDHDCDARSVIEKRAQLGPRDVPSLLRDSELAAAKQALRDQQQSESRDGYS